MVFLEIQIYKFISNQIVHHNYSKNNILEDTKMASNSKKTSKIRAIKAKPNRTNLKTNMARIQNNTQILKQLAADEK